MKTFRSFCSKATTVASWTYYLSNIFVSDIPKYFNNISRFLMAVLNIIAKVYAFYCKLTGFFSYILNKLKVW